MNLTTWAVLTDIGKERLRQEQLHGHDRDHSKEVWLAVLTEEVGEVAKALLRLRAAEKFGFQMSIEDAFNHTYDELIQVAAVAAAFAEVMGEELRTKLEKREAERRREREWEERERDASSE